MHKNDPYISSILNQRQKREQNLVRSPLNWFSLVGLYPLCSGDNTIGKGTGFTIDIPELAESAFAVLVVFKDVISLQRVSGDFSINGSPVSLRQLHPDTDEQPDLLECNALAMMVIRRGSRYFLRVWDRDAQALKDFRGLNYFPVNPSWCIEAEYIPFDRPREAAVTDVLGNESSITFPGHARFVIEGVVCTLLGEEDDDGLLFSFTDLTKLDATYPGGRYLLTGKPDGSKLILDFNLARNWPCAYTLYATCPLPPLENHLPVRVEAGEKRYHE